MRFLQKGIFRYLRGQRGDGGLLITAFIACVVIAVAAASVTQTMSGFFSGISAGQLAQKAFWLAEARAKEINVTPYANITTVAEVRANLTGYNFDREVVVGGVIDIGGGNTKRDILVNIYVPGETIPRVSLPVVATSASTAGPSEAHGKKMWTTPGVYTWTVPASITEVYITVCGAGGGGGGDFTAPYGYSRVGGGGSSGGVITMQILSVTPGQQLTATVGFPGTAGYNTYYDYNYHTQPTGPGGVGGASSVGGISAPGGNGGGGCWIDNYNSNYLDGAAAAVVAGGGAASGSTGGQNMYGRGGFGSGGDHAQPGKAGFVSIEW